MQCLGVPSSLLPPATVDVAASCQSRCILSELLHPVRAGANANVHLLAQACKGLLGGSALALSAGVCGRQAPIWVQ